MDLLRGLALAAPLVLYGSSACERAVDPSAIRAEARVTDVSVQILESFPVQARAVVRGEFPDGCTRIESIEQSREGNLFRLRIMTSRPSDLSCTRVLVPFEEVIPLDVQGLSAGEYRVLANRVAATFRLEVDNVSR